MIRPDELYHHGVKGMKWGVRRYQNYDGSRIKNGKKPVYKYRFVPDDDIIFPKGTVLSRIQKEANFDEYPFYATYKTHDKLAYLGLYGATLISRARRDARKLVSDARKNGGDVEDAKKQLSDVENLIVYQHNLAARTNIRMPSTRRASEITNDLIQQKRFRENLTDSIKYSKQNLHRPNQQVAFGKALKILKRDDLSNLSEREKRDIYAALNISLTFHEKSGLAVQKKFYGELKKYGYGAITDINDKMFSSYHAQDPLIFFDTSKVKSKDIVALDREYIYRTRGPFEAERLFKEAVGSVPMINRKRYDELYHFGIKGMKWGRRRYQNRDGSRTILGKKREKTDRETWRKKESKTLSDEELKRRIKRLQTEREYNNLIESEFRRDFRRGAKNIAGSATGKVVGTLATGAALVAAERALAKKLEKNGSSYGEAMALAKKVLEYGGKKK